MTLRTVLAAAALAAAAAVPGGASALTCYIVLDRNDNVVYRDTLPPIDLSDAGAAERERLRNRGEQLVAMDSDRCPNLEFFTGNAGSSNINVDQIVAGMPVGRTSPAAPVSGGSAIPKAAPARPAANRGGGS